jgi:hypothetical protein
MDFDPRSVDDTRDRDDRGRELSQGSRGGLSNPREREPLDARDVFTRDPGQYQALQHFITHSPWEATRVWTQLRAVVPVRAGILRSTTPASRNRGRARWACNGSTAGPSARLAILP